MFLCNQAAPSGPLSTAFAGRRFATILADPPWQFQNRTGKMAPEHKRLARYSTLKLDEIAKLPVEALATNTAHLYLWVPNALLLEGLKVMDAWGFTYKTNLVWHKVRKDGGPDGRGVGFYLSFSLVASGAIGRTGATRPPTTSRVGRPMRTTHNPQRRAS